MSKNLDELFELLPNLKANQTTHQVGFISILEINPKTKCQLETNTQRPENRQIHRNLKINAESKRYDGMLEQ